MDEIHQTSAELELCLALGKRAGCRFIWLSATVDPTFYATYLESREVLVTSAFDPKLKARVEVVAEKPQEFLDAEFVRRVIKQKRGVAVFVPTRAEVEQLAEVLGEQWKLLTTAFYHGGEPIRVIRPFLEGEVEHPWLLAMTAAGQSALNLRGLDTVVIYDARYGNVVDRGRNVLHRLYLGANEILQMAGRVHGRVRDGEVWILSDRDLHFESLRPGPPEFQLAGDAERVAVTCAAIGVDATDLELPVPLDRIAYRRAVELLSSRGLIENGRLTSYGKSVEAMPVDRAWGELLVSAEGALVPVVAVCSNIDSLHRMTRDERDLHGVVANGSDHLTAYNLFAEAVNQHGYLGEVYGLPRHLFEDGLVDWAERRGVLVKAIEDIALGTASVYRAMELPLPKTFAHASKDLRQQFAELVARIMPFDLVMDERTASGQEARVSRTSVAGSWGAVAGSLRWFADRWGTPRAAIEGTTLSYDLVQRHATWGPPVLEVGGPRKHQRVHLTRTREYFGFELDSDRKPLEGRFPAEHQEAALAALASALLAGDTIHPDQPRVRRAAEAMDEYWRRSGGRLAVASADAVRALLVSQLEAEGVNSWETFIRARVSLDIDALIDSATRAELDALKDSARIKGDVVPMSYDVVKGRAVVRLALREGQVRRVRADDLPEVDRPLVFEVRRGNHAPIRADSLEELRAQLERLPRGRPQQRHQRRGRRR